MRGLMFFLAWLVPALALAQQPGAVPLPQDVKQFLGLQVGTWEVTPTDRQAKWKAHATFRWMPGNYALMWAFKVDGTFADGTPFVGSQSGIYGWDHVNRKVVVHAFDSWGGTTTSTYRLTTGGLEGEMVAVHADATRHVSAIKWTMHGHDEYLWSATGQDGSVFEARNVRTGK